MFKPIVAGALALGLATSATAGTIIVGSYSVTAISAASPTPPPFQLFDLGTSPTTGFQSSAPLSVGGAAITFTPNASIPFSGVYAGTVANQSVSPFTGTTLGVQAPNGQNRNYLAAQPNNNVNFTYAAPQTSFSLLWGTVDDFNQVEFSFFNGTTLVGTQLITGTNVANAVGGGFLPNGSTAAYVTIAPTSGTFNNVVFRSIQNSAFEFVPGAVPEPATWGMMILGFGAIGAAMRRRPSIARVAA